MTAFHAGRVSKTHLRKGHKALTTPAQKLQSVFRKVKTYKSALQCSFRLRRKALLQYYRPFRWVLIENRDHSAMGFSVRMTSGVSARRMAQASAMAASTSAAAE